MRHANRDTAFTLVELLVVIGIIGLLISILLPTLSKVRQAGDGVKCLANLRTLCTAARMVSQSTMPGATSKNLPGYVSFSGETIEGRIASWWGASDFSDSSKNIPAGRGYWARFGVTDSTVLCPGMKLLTVPANPNLPFIGYGLNDLLASTKGFRYDRVRSDSDTFMFADSAIVDSYGSSGLYATNGEFAPPYNSFQLIDPEFHGRHNSRGGVGWLDGHASLEAPILPDDTTGLKWGRDVYKRLNMGYLVRNPAEIKTVYSLYYYVYDKKVVVPPNTYVTIQPATALWR